METRRGKQVVSLVILNIHIHRKYNKCKIILLPVEHSMRSAIFTSKLNIIKKYEQYYSIIIYLSNETGGNVLFGESRRRSFSTS